MEISLAKSFRKYVNFIVILGIVLYRFLGHSDQAIFQSQTLYRLTSAQSETFCQQVEADAEYLSATISDIFYLPANQDIEPAEIYAKLPVDFGNPWRISKCGKRFFIHVFDRSGKCPAEYQNQHQEWSGNTYTLRF